MASLIKWSCCFLTFGMLSCQETESSQAQANSAQTDLLQESTTQERNDDCTDNLWNYNNVGAPFMMTWCTSCHHAELPEEQRSDATVGVDLDTYAAVVHYLDRIQARALSEPPTMPPAGGPSDEELQRLQEWIDCGAPQ